jgi:iron complex outermembrane receptor protein
VGVEPSVSTIVDGVVYTRVGSVFDGLNDLERVEVLNGPQGTLQGKNASAGAVVIVTKAPIARSWAARSKPWAQNNEYGLNALLTGPLSTTAFRVAGYYHREDGLVTNIATGKTVNNVETYGLRGKFLYEPHDGLTFTLAGDWSYRKADCCGEPIRVAAASGNVTAAFTGAQVGPMSQQVNFNTEQVGWQKNRGVSLTTEAKLGDFSLTSITAFRQYRDFAIRDRDGTNAPFTGVTPQQLFSATNPGITAADALTKMQSLLLNPVSFACRTTNGNLSAAKATAWKRATRSARKRLASPTGGFADYIVGAFYYNSMTERDLTIGGVRSNIAGNVTFPRPPRWWWPIRTPMSLPT